jgi:hypothetical protein
VLTYQVGAREQRAEARAREQRAAARDTIPCRRCRCARTSTSRSACGERLPHSSQPRAPTRTQ